MKQKMQNSTRKIYQGFAYSDLKSLIDTVDHIIASNPEANLTYESFSFDYETDYDSDRIMVLEYSLPETEKERLARLTSTVRLHVFLIQGVE